MKIVWFGHATFFAKLDNKTTILFDPYDKNACGSSFTYSDNFPKCDIVLISHNHRDHSFRDFKKKFGYQPVIIDKEGNYEHFGIKIRGRKFYHDQNQGRDRGESIAFSVNTEKGDIIHFGDIGERAGRENFKEMIDPYIAMVPVGGNFTIDYKQACELMELISPRFIFPMHYKTEHLDFPIDNADRFIKTMKNYRIRRVDSFDDDEEKMEENTLFILTPSNEVI